MNAFAITEIDAGWVAAQLHTALGLRTVGGSYTPNDAIRDFVNSVASLATADSATCSWHQEPGDVTWQFARTKARITVTIHSPQHSAECCFQWLCFASDVPTTMKVVLSTVGEGAYEREWRHPFPKEACEKLERAILGV